MNRIISSAVAVGVVLLMASVALANAGPPRPPQSLAQPSVAIAAVAGVAGALVAGWWFVRRMKP